MISTAASDESASDAETHLGFPVAGHDEGERGHVQDGKEVLGQEDVGAFVGDVVERRVSVDVGGRVDQRAGAALDGRIVALARHILGHLLHVGLPVNLGVWPERTSASPDSLPDPSFAPAGAVAAAAGNGRGEHTRDLPDDQGAEGGIGKEQDDGDEPGQGMASVGHVQDKADGLRGQARLMLVCHGGGGLESTRLASRAE